VRLSPSSGTTPRDFDSRRDSGAVASEGLPRIEDPDPGWQTRLAVSQDADPAAVLAELEDLRAETERLRQLLGLDARNSAGHRSAWAPTLFSQPSSADPLDEGSPIEGKVTLIRSLFGARDDVFATRWENQRSGKTGCSPAVRADGPRSMPGRITCHSPMRSSPAICGARRPSESNHCSATTPARCLLVTSMVVAECWTHSPSSTPATP
jgi:hypothetical protein